MRTESAEALDISLHGQRVAVLAHYAGGKNILTFDPAYAATSNKHTLTLTQHIDHQYLQKPQIHTQRIPPLLSNLLPEGALREWMAQSLKVHIENEFPLLIAAGKNLAGALKATAINKGQIPQWALTAREQVEPVQIDIHQTAHKFSLAGVQMKLSSHKQDGRFNIVNDQELDSWIIKTPSTINKGVTVNEYSSMKLAQAIGVDIPDIALVDLTDITDLPDIPLPNERYAYAIKRFDRNNGIQIHTEDFAQIFNLYAHDKYGKRNYEQMAAVIYQYSEQGLLDIQQMARRLLANILLGNGDAHLKNWSLIYSDKINPKLTPAYDIVSTLPYVPGENSIALNMGKEKRWDKINLNTFRIWAERIDINWLAIKAHLEEAITLAKEQWPSELKELPMLNEHKDLLKDHWKSLKWF